MNAGVPDLFPQDPHGFHLPRTTTGTAERTVVARLPAEFGSRGREWGALLEAMTRSLQCPAVADADRGEPVNTGDRAPLAQPGETIDAFLDRFCRI